MNRVLELIKLIEKNPTIKYNEIMRETGLKNGTLSYHLKKLEENGNVKVKRNLGETRFYPLYMTEDEYIIIKSLRQETPRRILLALLCDEKLSFAEIVKRANKSQSTISIYLSKLIENKIVEANLVDLKKMYHIKNSVMVREIIQKYNPLLLERIAYNFADTFSNL